MTGGTALRAARGSDVDDIARIWEAGWRDAHADCVPEALSAFREASMYPPRVRARLGGTWVALRHGVVAGFVVVHGDELEQLYVAAAARGTGIGVALLRHGAAVIAAGGYERAWLAVATGNVEARGFYECAGWADAGPISYAAEAGEASVEVPCRRLELALGDTVPYVP
ncbi:ribosomal protein S18 acetylase RimI-like enzyme [Diaminobutyricimonas aerilata]|uniref:Ribosomal protein S18 acetylase RimI-like enzyme n=1 Tax=Diaminobutyricimonas aerilata TaxID=1162967 RepID=A0A2M9CIM5_9MICO|nr:GNAT family N-acetyltransferase [Diaminobutyricimonas aerilata]PJJ71705.1 ribosomal protein S18 acetylase RimI-like enzyme [Diaminobutyricimonas aerilata]